MKNQRLILHVAYLKKRKGLEQGVHISRHCRIIVYRPVCTGIVHVIVKKLTMRNTFLPALNPKKWLSYFLTSNTNKTVYIKRTANNRNFYPQEGGGGSVTPKQMCSRYSGSIRAWRSGGSNPGEGNIVSSTYPSRPTLRVTQLPLQRVPGLLAGGKAAEAWHWPPTLVAGTLRMSTAIPLLPLCASYGMFWGDL